MFTTLQDVIDRIASDAEFVCWVIRELHKRQTEDERQSRETRWLNCFGFSKKHVTRGETYIRWMNSGEPLSPLQVAAMRDLAMHYRKQAFYFVLGAVPENTLDMTRR